MRIRIERNERGALCGLVFRGGDWKAVLGITEPGLYNIEPAKKVETRYPVICWLDQDLHQCGKCGAIWKYGHAANGHNGTLQGRPCECGNDPTGYVKISELLERYVEE